MATKKSEKKKYMLSSEFWGKIFLTRNLTFTALRNENLITIQQFTDLCRDLNVEFCRCTFLYIPRDNFIK